MWRHLFKLFALLPLVPGLAGCDRRALEISPVAYDAMHVTGQTFCLARGIVSLVVSLKPEPKAGGGGGDKFQGPEFSQSGVRFDDETAFADAAGADQGVKPSDKEDAGSATTATMQNLTLTVDNVRYIPDCDFQYTVNLNHDIFHSDKVAVEIDPATKLLKGVNATLKDETPQIIRKIANAPVDVINAANAAQKTPTDYFEIKHDVDPTDKRSVEIFNAHLAGLKRDIRLRTRPLVQLPHPPREKAHCREDLCFRTAMPYVVELATEDGGSPRVISQKIVVVPNPYLVASVPVTRAAFVEKKVILDFKDGMLVKSDIDNPSEVLAFVGIPIDVAKAIVAIPSAMFKFELKQVQNDAALLKAQKELLQEQKGLIDAQNALLAAAGGGA